MNKEILVIDSNDNELSNVSHNPVKVSFTDDIYAKYATLCHYSTQNDFYNIHSGNNRFVLEDVTPLAETVLTVPPGSYSFTELADTIESLMNNAGGDTGYIVDGSTASTNPFDEIVRRIVIRNTNNVAFTVTFSGIGKALGFADDDIGYPSIPDGGQEVVSGVFPPHIIINSIYVQIDEFKSMLQKSSNNYAADFYIPVEFPRGDIDYQNVNETFNQRCEILSEPLRSLRITLRDPEGGILQNVSRWKMVLCLENQPLTGQRHLVPANHGARLSGRDQMFDFI